MTDQAYTEAEVQALVAQELLKQRVQDVERQVGKANSMMESGFAKMDAKLDGVDRNIIRAQDSMQRRTEELRKEIERDFVSKPEFTTKIAELSGKVDKIWIRITATVSTVVVIAQVLVKVFF